MFRLPTSRTMRGPQLSHRVQAQFSWLVIGLAFVVICDAFIGIPSPVLKSTTSSTSIMSTSMTTTETVTEDSVQSPTDWSQPSSKKEKTVHPQRVVVVGAGAVGTYYGARLQEAGHSVQWLMRGDHYIACTTNGLNVTSPHGNMYLPPEEIHACQSTTSMDATNLDWIVVSLKSTSLDAIPSLLVPLFSVTMQQSKQPRILAIMNGMIEDDLLDMLRKATNQTSDGPLTCCQALYGGMAFICCNRLQPGLTDHSYAGLLTAGVASTRSESSSEDQKAFESLWESTNVPFAFDDSLVRGRWKKMIWNLPFNGLTVAMNGLTVDQVVGDASLRELAFLIMDETIAAANADMEYRYGSNNFDPLGHIDKIAMMNLSDTMGAYRTSTMIDLTTRQKMEVRYLFQVPLRRAKELGIQVPHLETIVAQIEALQRMYGL